MSRYNLQTAKLIISEPQRKTSIASCFITQPKVDEQERLGQIFILSELKIKKDSQVLKTDYQIFIDAATKSIKDNYYQTGYVAETIELNFESALQKTNQELKNFFSGQKSLFAQDFLENLNIVIGAVKKHEVHFSYIGNVEAYIIHDNKISSICSGINHEIHGPENSIQHQNQKISPFKIFSHLVSGNLESDNGLLISTENLLDYFSLEKLKKIITENNPLRACQNLQNLLSEIDDKPNIAAFIAKLQTESAEKKYEPTKTHPAKNIPRPKKINLEDSIAELLSRQEETSQILTPSIKPLIKKILAFGWLGYLTRKPRERKKLDPRENIIRTLKTCVPKSQPAIAHFPKNKTKNRFFKIIFGPMRVLKNFLCQIQGKFTQRKEKIFVEIKKPKRYFSRLPFSSKALLFLVIILGALFIQSIILLNQRQIKEKEVKTYNFTLNKIEALQSSAAAALIYKDEKKAKELYKNALGLIADLPSDSKKHQEKTQALTQEIQIALDKINKLRKITNPKILIDLSRLSFFKAMSTDGINTTAIKPKNIVKQGNNLYTFRPDDNSFFVIDLSTSEVKPLENVGNRTDKITTIRNWNDTALLLYYGTYNIAKLDLDKKTISPLELEARPNLYIQDLSIYDDRLYLLAPNKNLILKYYKTLAGFGKETPWLKDETNIRDAQSLAIDSSAWIQKKDGQIVNLMMGVKQDFSSTEIEPPLAGPKKIWTSNGSSLLYIADPPTKRLIILTKEGKIKEQLGSDEFDELQDFAVDEAGGKIYVLNGLIIYEVLLNKDLTD